MAEDYSSAYLRAWHKRVRPWLTKYLPGIAERLERMARAEAGGRSSPRRVSETEKMALHGVTVTSVRDLTNTELFQLHRRCHELGGGD